MLIMKSRAFARLFVCSNDGIARVFELELQAVGDQRDELRIGRLALRVRDGVAEEALQCLKVAAVPRDLDRMPDGPFYARRRC